MTEPYSSKLKDLIERFQALSLASIDSYVDPDEYLIARRMLAEDPTLGPHIPSFVKACGSLGALTAYLKGNFPREKGGYGARRAYIVDEMRPLRDVAEGAPVSARPAVTSATSPERLVVPMPEEFSVPSGGPSSFPYTGPVKVFISHNSEDKAFASSVVELLRAALNLTSAEIRCSSLDGYRFAGGTDLEEGMRELILGAPLVVGLVTCCWSRHREQRQFGVGSNGDGGAVAG